jgi:membrane-associated protein
MSLLSAEKIAHAGIVVVAGVIFAESGLMVGFFLPGDSLLFTAGFLASQGFVNVHVLAGACFVAAVIGDSVGYAFGKRMGPRLLKRPDGKIFKKKYIAQAEAFYQEHGKKTIILARFTPIVRTFAPIVAGLGSMNYRTFLTYNVIGGALWTLGLTYLGYFLGGLIPEGYLEPAILLVIFISLLPAFHHFLKEAENREKLRKLPSTTIAHIKKTISK